MTKGWGLEEIFVKRVFEMFFEENLRQSEFNSAKILGQPIKKFFLVCSCFRGNQTALQLYYEIN